MSPISSHTPINRYTREPSVTELTSPRLRPTPGGILPGFGSTGERRQSDAVLGAVAHQERQLRELLRSRLLVFVMVIVGFYGVLPLASLPVIWQPTVSTTARVTLAFQFVAAALIAAVGALAWRKPAKSMRTLRALEFCAFFIGAGYLAVSNMITGLQWGLAAPPMGPIGHPLVTLEGTRLDPITLRWLVMIAAYGTLIPNTWQRTAIVVGLMDAAYLASVVALGVMSDLPAAQFTTLLFYPVVWTIAATVLAVVGSYRVSMLQQRVYDAQRLGQYRLKQQLGAGGMGEVYLAEHVALKQPFAVKLLRPERVSSPKVLQRFEREVRAMAALEHWNTVEVYDYGHAADGTFYYVMEYLDGLDLDQIVKKEGPLLPGRAIHLLRQVCGALQESHARGLLHRDIKPANIIVCERAGFYDVAKLCDFGLVKSVVEDGDQGVTQEGTVPGTPAFMSPEHASGQVMDGRSDIYSLGALTYYLVTGRLPFQKGTAMQMLAAQIYETPLPPSRFRADLDPFLDALILRCLEKDPADRYPDVAALDAALASCAERHPWTQADAMTWWSTAHR